MKVWESISSFIYHAQLLRLRKIRGQTDKIYFTLLIRLILLNSFNLRKVNVYPYNASCNGWTNLTKYTASLE